MARIELNADTVPVFLEGGGWPCESIADGVWRSRFRGKSGSFTMLVRLEPAYVTFAVVPYLKSPEDDGRSGPLYHRLLELNCTMRMAKYSIDDDLDVVLSVEYPTRELDQSELDDALDVLSFYADRHYEELRALIA